jgi:cyanophycin synthetase
VVKPARLSGAGDGVTTGVESRRDLRRASVFAAFFRNELLIERQIPGDSYRLLYLEGELVDAIRRRPPSVTGDGRSTIRSLIETENRRRAEARGSAAVRRIRIDLDCLSTLRRSGLSLSSVPAGGSLVHVKTAVNNNSFEDNESILPLVGKALAEEGARAARAMGSHLAGVDVITPDPSVALGACGGVINEVNGEPGIHHHYNIRNPEATSGLGAIILRRLLPA